jgi:TRAP-type C4-dicarboxylate transport system permease small subunit
MHSTVERISRFFTNIFAGGASISMIIVFLIVFINSLRRYSFGKSYEWGEELPVFIAIYGIMFGMAYAYMQDRHVRFTILVGFLPEHLTRKLYLLVDLIVIATGAVLSWSGWLFIVKRGGMESSGMINLAKSLQEAIGWDQLIWLGYFYPYQAAIILGGILLVIAASLKLLSRLYKPQSPILAERVAL